MRATGIKLGFLCAGVMACALSHGQAVPTIQREFRAAWTATVYNIDWPSSSGLTTTQQQNEIIALLDHLRNTKMNVVLVQVRPQADAFYQIATEPWSQYLRGTMGTAPSPLYDPLAFWIQQARARGIAVHAWINPYRAKAGTATVSAPNHVTNSHCYMVRTYGTNKWIDPGHPEAQGYTLAAINQIVANYDVDGIVIDDYFYPYPVSGETFPDDSTYNVYVANGGTLTRENWRRQNVDTFVQSAYNAVKASKPWVQFGISPFGIWRPGNPAGVTGLDAFASIYADSKKWINNGWCDYFSPQLYWTINSTGQPYDDLLTWWVQQNTQNRLIVPSNSISNIGTAGAGWPVSEIVNQINVTRTTTGARGNILYSIKVLRDNRDGLRTTLQSGVYASHSLIPAFTWLDNVPPARPRTVVRQTGSNVTINLTPGNSEEVRWWTVYTRYGSTWTTEVLPGNTSQIVRAAVSGSRLHTVFIGAVDRSGNESARATVGFLGAHES